MQQYYCGDTALYLVMTGNELLKFLQGLSEEDLSKDIVLEEGDCDRVYDLDSVYEIEDDIVLSISQVYE